MPRMIPASVPFLPYGATLLRRFGGSFATDRQPFFLSGGRVPDGIFRDDEMTCHDGSRRRGGACQDERIGPHL